MSNDVGQPLAGQHKKTYAELDVGDMVAVGGTNPAWRFAKIVNITRTRQFTLDTKQRFTDYGKLIGGFDEWHPIRFYPLGHQAGKTLSTYYDLVVGMQARWQEATQKRKLVYQIEQLTDGRLENLTADQLHRIVIICQEGKGNGDPKQD